MPSPPGPSTLRGAERRRDARRVLAVEAHLSWTGTTHALHTLDLSEGGAQLIAKRRFTAPERALLRVNHSELVGHGLSCAVVWARQATQLGEAFRVGVQFGELPDGARQALRRVLAESELDAELPEVEADEVQDAEPMGPPEDVVDPFLARSLGGPRLGDVVSAQDFARQLSAAVAEDHHRRADQQQEAERLVSQARRAATDRRWRDAIRDYEKALQLMPESAEMAQELAAAAYESGDVIRAAELFDRALRLGAT